MDWIKKMNETIKYIEDHITEEIEMDQLSQISCHSIYHLQTMFRMLTDMTITEYIRKRRLTLAVKELTQNRKKVIDVSLKYGYETPESFTKAFKKYHGVTPSSAKKGNQSFQATMPLYISITLKGAKPMDYRIEKKEKMSFKGIKKRVSTHDGENFKVIPQFWHDFFDYETADMFNNNIGSLGYIGACYNFDEEKEELDFLIGVENNKNIYGETIEVLDIPEATWAVFTSIGKMPDAIQDVWKRIFQEFFPATNYEHAKLPELEVYPAGDTRSDDYKCEVWIPIIEKNID